MGFGPWSFSESFVRTKQRGKMMNPLRLAVLLCVGPLLGAAPPKDKEKPKPEPEYAPYKNYVPTDRMIEFYQAEIKRDPKSYGSYTLLGSMYLRRARETGDYTRSEERRVGKECRSRWSP